MKKKVLACFIMVVSLLVLYVNVAFAAEGNTNSAVVFQLHVDSGNASIRLKSSKGLACVSKVNTLGDTIGYEEEKSHGFYNVIVTGPGKNETLKWVPSISKFIDKKGKETSSSLTIDFPYAGDYTVKVEPISERGYWLIDSIEYWISPATWSVVSEKNCYIYNTDGVSYTAGALAVDTAEVVAEAVVGAASEYQNDNLEQRSGQKPMGYVDVYYYIDNSLFEVETISISNSQWIYSKTIPGYACSTTCEYVEFDNTTGKCNPSTVDFYFYKTATPAPTRAPVTSPPVQSHGTIITPSYWETQFDGTSQQPYNEKAYTRLPNLSDNNPSTSFYWVIWRSERQDSIPELTANFYNSSISSIGIRNGNVNSESSYYKYARACRFKIRIFHSGGVYETYFNLSDYYTRDYQTFSLGRTYNGVSRIEFYLDSGDNACWTGSGEKYVIHISDIQFTD